MKTMMRALALSLSAFTLLLLSRQARAACSPTQTARFNLSALSMQFCNGTDWVPMQFGAVTNCSAASKGQISYINGEYEFCDGLLWYSMKGSLVTTCSSGNLGQITWNTGTSTLQFCDGSNIYSMAASTTSQGYFVMTSDWYASNKASAGGNLGGLIGANRLCYDDLNTFDWLGKSAAGPLSPNRVTAWLCDSTTCNNFKPSSTYAYAFSGNTAFGGLSFTTDASGLGPNDSSNWGSGTTTFRGSSTNYWSGRSAGTSTAGGGTPGASTCADWSTNITGTGVRGQSTTGTTRWNTTAANCTTTSYRLLCLVAPKELSPDPVAFVDVTGATVSTATNSNIVAITGLSSSVSVSVWGDSGTPKYRICSEATCTAGSPAFVSTASTISSGQYLQLQITSSAAAGTKFTEQIQVGGTNLAWNVTTAGSPGGYFILGSVTPARLDFGSLTAADEICYNDLATNNWMGKSAAGGLTRNRVKAWLCDSKSCNSFYGNTAYAFGVSKTPGTGGEVFTANAAGLGPGTNTSWATALTFGTTAVSYLTARSAGSDPYYAPNTPFDSATTDSACGDWSNQYATTSNRGSSSGTNQNRWSGQTAVCGTGRLLICMVHPNVGPTSLVFSDVTNSEVVSLTTSNILPMTGLTSIASVYPDVQAPLEYQICNDAACSSVATAWTKSANQINSSQFLQLRILSASISKSTASGVIHVGAAESRWSVTTGGSNANLGYFVLTASDFDGVFGGAGGLPGANAACLTELNSASWLGKSNAGALSAARVTAFLCDGNTCNQTAPFTKYAFARAGSTSGGATFITDSRGAGPGDLRRWDDPTVFGTTASYWTARADVTGGDLIGGHAYYWSMNPNSVNTCLGWSSNVSPPNNGGNGATNVSEYGRFLSGSGNCSNTNRLICIVAPGPVPSSFAFVNQTGVPLNTIIQSNIVQLTGSAVTATIGGSANVGSPQFRICADASCATVLKNWRATPALMESGQYIQLQMTSSAGTFSQATYTATVVAGATSSTWSITTVGPIPIFLTAASGTWTVPADWNNSTNSIECIGGGGGGGSITATVAAAGGGGGAYSKITSATFTPNASISYQIGIGGAATVAGGDSWVQNTSLILAKGGSAGGAGGLASSGVGSTRSSGGDGGAGRTGGDYGGGGGGGAGGPGGNGAAGGAAPLVWGGGGGGGASGGSVGATGVSNSLGGAGGNNSGGAGGGAGGAGANGAGASGTVGGGGGGGTDGGIGGAGGVGISITGSEGSGGGGGGGGDWGFGGNGANYGGGGGGAGNFHNPPSNVSGKGANGICVILYTP
jgi:hypothetical protein